jgi:hypothetical protein
MGRVSVAFFALDLTPQMESCAGERSDDCHCYGYIVRGYFWALRLGGYINAYKISLTNLLFLNTELPRCARGQKP